jgi:glycine/sarcosine N-methyltransferase
MPDDPYASFHYRSVIAWPQRLAREWPFLEDSFAQIPVRRILDLGCGTGEHAALLASHGFEVVGIDASASMLEQAREAVKSPDVTFIAGDIAEVGALAAGTFGAAICLGNTLPHVEDAGRLTLLARGLREKLAPGGVFVLQMLNYERIFARGQRYLPPTFRRDADGETVFLRLMDPQQDGRTVIFCPSTFRYRPDADHPLEILSTRRVMLRGWRCSEVETILADAGFADRRVYGGYDASAYDPLESPDLLLVVH